MKSKVKTVSRGWYTTHEELHMLDEIIESIGASNMSAAIRYCIRQTHKQLQKEQLG